LFVDGDENEKTIGENGGRPRPRGSGKRMKVLMIVVPTRRGARKQRQVKVKWATVNRLKPLTGKESILFIL